MKQLLLGLLLASGCLDAPEDVSATASPLESENALSANQLSANGVSLNGVSLNKLGVNGVSVNKLGVNKLGVNGVSLNGIESLHAASPELAEMLATADGRHVFSYVVRCALDESTAIIAELGEESYVFRGSLGVVPTWLAEPLSADGRAWMSACLLSHVNAFGVSVPISLRGELAVLAATPDEATTFPHQEAAFFGDLFATTPQLYGCLGWDARSASPSPYLAERACIAGTATGGTSACGFVNVGACETTCANATHTGGGTADEAWEDCAVNGTTYPSVVTVFLRATR